MSALPDPTSYQAIGWLIVALAALVVILNNGLKLADRMKGKPPASQVAAESAEKFVSKPEFREHVHRSDVEHQNIWKKLGGLERGLGAEMKAMELRIQESDEHRSEKLHDRVNEVLAAVSELRGAMERKL